MPVIRDENPGRIATTGRALADRARAIFVSELPAAWQLGRPDPCRMPQPAVSSDRHEPVLRVVPGGCICFHQGEHASTYGNDDGGQSSDHGLGDTTECYWI